MLKQLLASSLVIALASAGLPPCVGMDMDAGAMAEHQCCEAGACPDAVDNGPRHGSSLPQADCCVFASTPAQRSPAERTTSDLDVRAPAAATAPEAWHAAVVGPILVPTGGPPGSPGIARHLLLSVLLI